MSPAFLPRSSSSAPSADAARADLVHEVVGTQPIGDLAVADSLHIDGDQIAISSRPFDFAELGELLPEPVEPSGDLGLGRLKGRDRHDETLVAGDRDLRAHLYDSVEGQSSGVLAGGDVDLRGRDRVDVRLFDGLGVVVRERVTDHLGPDGLSTEADLEEPTRDLSRAEAGNGNLFLEAANGLVDRAFEFLLVDLDGELDSVALEGLRSRTHRSLVLYRAHAVAPATGAQGGREALASGAAWCLYDRGVALRSDGA